MLGLTLEDDYVRSDSFFREAVLGHELNRAGTTRLFETKATLGILLF